MCLLEGEIKVAYISHPFFILLAFNCILNLAGDTLGVGPVDFRNRNGMEIGSG